jgi:glycosyltransferase involved in cell wall biosynthesis
MRVALVLATSTGGVGEHVRSLAGGLVDRGHVVSVLGPAATEERFDFTGAGATFAPVEIASGSRPVQDALAVRALRTALIEADVVHAHGLRAGLVAGRARRTPGRRIPLVATWHNAVLVGGVRARAYVPLERYVARAAEVTLAVSSDLAARAQALGASNVRHALVPAPAPAPAGPEARQRVRDELGARDRPVLLTVARLQAQKGQRVLLEAARAWAERDPTPVVVLAGEGPDRAALADTASRLAVRVLLLGHRSDIPDLLAASDVVVLPSRWEGQPLVVQEALRAGRPLVATDVGGVPDLVGDAALLVEYGDSAALAAAVARVLDDPDIAGRLAAAGPVQAATWPDLGQALDQVEGIYAELARPNLQ